MPPLETLNISRPVAEVSDADVETMIGTLQRIVDAAEKLKVKTVIGPECGHAYMAIRW